MTESLDDEEASDVAVVTSMDMSLNLFQQLMSAAEVEHLYLEKRILKALSYK